LAQPAQEPVAYENELLNRLAVALHDAVLIRIGGDDEATWQAIARIDKLVAKYTSDANSPAAPVQGQTVYLGDEPAWNDQFEAWWENHGQLCRAGGGDYEKTFAFRAYEAALTTPPAQPAHNLVT